MYKFICLTNELKKLVKSTIFVLFIIFEYCLGAEIPGSKYNEYFLDQKPIKVVEYKGKYWIVDDDGCHRFYRGLIQGYLYFLVEISYLWKPSNEIRCYNVAIYQNRPAQIPIIHNKSSDDIEFDNETLEKFLNVVAKRYGNIITFYKSSL